MYKHYTVFLAGIVLGIAGHVGAAEAPCAAIKDDAKKLTCYQQAIGELEQELDGLYQDTLDEFSDPKAKAEFAAEQQSWQQRQTQETLAAELDELAQRRIVLQAWQDKLTGMEDGVAEASAPSTLSSLAAGSGAAIPAVETDTAEADDAAAETDTAEADDAAAETDTAEADDATAETPAVVSSQARGRGAAVVNVTKADKSGGTAKAGGSAPVQAKAKTAAAKKRAKRAVPARKTPEKEPVWMVQLGSFRTREQAEIFVKALKTEGFKLRIEPSREWYAVRLWPQPDRGGALRQLQEWQDKTGREDAIVVEIKNPRRDWW